MNVFIKYHGKTVGPYGVGGFQNLNSTMRREVKDLVMKAAQDDGNLPPDSLFADMVFVFDNSQAPIYAHC